MNTNIVINNRIVTSYKHDGDIYIEGRKGSEYSIQIKNPYHTRVKVVVSVDGLNVISGDKEFFENAKGYVIEPYQTIIIKGWRKSDKEVAAFKFGSIKDSYNSKNENGEITSIGAIGVMFFKEKLEQISLNGSWSKWIDRSSYPDVYPAPIRPWYGNDIKCSASSIDVKATRRIVNSNISTITSNSTTSINNVGTEYGNSIDSIVNTVYYDFEKNPYIIEVLFYDDIKGLEARGIKVKPEKPLFVKPNPFPTQKYCPEPK